MRRCGADRQARRPSLAAAAFAALGALAASLAVAGQGRAEGLMGANYQLNWDQTVKKTDVETTSTWTLKQSLDIKYRGFLSPVVQNEITLTISEDLKSEGEPRDVIRVSPVITLEYKGSYWSAGAKRTIDDSNEPGKNAKIADSYFVELFYRPPRQSLPDFKGKYTLNADSESGQNDTLKHAVNASSVYKPNKWLEIRGDYEKNWAVDRLKPDSDTQDEKYSGELGIRHVVSRKVKVNSQVKAENSGGGTLLTAGGTKNDKHDQSYEWKNTLAFLPFRNTTMDASYDWSGKQNLETGEHGDTSNYKAALSQSIFGVVDIKGDVSRIVTDTRHSADDYEKVEDTWTLDSRLKLGTQWDLTVKYQKKGTTEDHFGDPTRSTTSGTISRSAALNGTVTKFWKGSATFDRTDNIERETTTTIDTKYGLKSTFDFKAINLILDPSYDIALKDDRKVTPPVASETRDFKFKVAWKFLTTNNIDGKMDHTFGRKRDTLAKNIQRTDNSNVNFAWSDPLPGWIFAFDVTRSATDTSMDDLPPDITAAVSLKADYKHERLKVSANYKYDRKKLTDDSETIDFKCGWTTPQWEASLTYTFNKTFSTELNEGYTLGIAFKYNL